jgi:hypothetical protein
MHNGQLANPRNAFTKQLSAVSKGKSKNLDEAERIEFLGSLYTDEKGAPCITGDMVYAMHVEGAKGRKLGKQAKAGVFEAQPNYPLIYDGPKDPDKLFADGRFSDYRGVRVQQNRIMRSRPIFRAWAVDISVLVNTESMSIDDVKLAFEYAGSAKGLGDYRPRFGRFIVEKVY